ncbi:MAG: 23S rRNA (adenine(2030)-N(6))-methyltransferase RlmJ [Alphaproteobacteria bacterium]|nr:23S rRNA (adenine(2030)-N(6))-methyltransferase RlmJ [Alphaproteobacteria bacterium]
MNYRHLYHAGNFADVFKHAILALVIERLKAKDAPFAVIDTHAGAGLYDISGPEAQKTGEFARGYGQIASADLPAALAPYRAAVAQVNPEVALRFYPGSPLLALALMRPRDRLVACELHPDEARALKRALGRDKRAEVHERDGYAALKAFLPPKERRGLVLIDPPFEAPAERRRVVRALAQAHARWPTGIYALWYPIKADSEARLFHAELANTGIRRQLACEVRMQAGDEPARLNGCGLVIVNPPFQIEATLRQVLPALHAALAGAGGTRVDWVVPE